MPDWSRLGIPESLIDRLEDIVPTEEALQFLSRLLKEYLGTAKLSQSPSFEDLCVKISEAPPEKLKGFLKAMSAFLNDPSIKIYMNIGMYGQAINRHDHHSHPAKPVDTGAFEMVPWIWITGEPHTDRREYATIMLGFCAERDHVDIVYCGLGDEKSLLSEIFGSTESGSAADGHIEGKLRKADMGFLIFFEADKLPKRCQEKLLRWRDNSSIKSIAERQLPIHNKSGVVGAADETELVDAVIIFIADTNPRELVSKGLVLEGLVSGAVKLAVPPLRECLMLIEDKLRSLVVQRAFLRKPNDDPLENWTTEALDLVCGYPWPDNIAGLKALVDTLFYSGALRSSSDVITAKHIEKALENIYGDPSPASSGHPGQAGSTLLDFLPAIKEATEPPPGRGEWPRIFQDEFQGKPGAVSKMALKYGINRSMLSTTLNAAGIKTGKGGRPPKATR